MTPPWASLGRTALLALVLLGADVATLFGGTSDHLFLPLPTKRIRNFARFELETRWVSGNGYRPVKVKIFNMPPGPTTSDRDFRVRITPHGYYGVTHEVTADAIVEMPENTSVGEAWIAVPQTFEWHRIDIEVREGGSRIPELCHDGFSLGANNMYPGNNAFTEASPSVLFIDSKTPAAATRDSLASQFRGGADPNPTHTLPDVRMWQFLAPQPVDPWNRAPNVISTQPDTTVISDANILNLVASNRKLELLPFADLPDKWLCYTSLDMIFVSLEDAQALARQEPEKWEAIRRWAASGPTLVITGLGPEFAQLDQVEELLKLSKLEAGPNDLEGHGGWEKPGQDHAYSRVRSIDSTINYDGNVYYGGAPGTPGNPYGTTPVPNSMRLDLKKTPFVMRTTGLGRVAAMATDKPLSNPPHDLSWLLNQVDARNWMSFQRHGVSTTRANTDFMTFLIEGTGRVPVWSFLVLISAFVIVIGPVNYMLLKRWRRLFLLLVTVPAGAAVITLSLFSYAVISDGLGVRTRARSFTRLDQRTGQMASWSRQTYYAGLAPSGGLRFPDDAAVYPIEERPFSGGNSPRRRELVWSDDEQQLRSGYLSSRQTSQFLVLRSDASQRKLEVKSTGANSPPQVTNKLDAHIEHLVLCDKDGKIYQASNIEPDGETLLSIPAKDKNESPLALAMRPFSAMYNERRPQLPFGYQTDNHSGGLFGFTSGSRRIYYYDQGYARNLSTPSFSSSILERELMRTATNNNLQLERGTYLVLLSTSPEMPQGYSRVKEKGSLHILEGRW